MVNKQFVTWTTRNKMPPKIRLGLGWDSLKFSFNLLTMVLLSIMSGPGIYSGLYLTSRTVKVFDHAVVVICAILRTSILFASINWVSEQYSITHCKSDYLHLKQPEVISQWLPSNGHQCAYDSTTTGSCNPPFLFHRKLKRSQAEKYPDSRENCLQDKTLRIQKFSDSKFPL